MQLDVLFKPFAALINRRIAEQTPARQLAADLNDTTIGIRVDETALALYLRMLDGQLTISSRYDDEPDVVLSGSLLSLAALAGSDPQSVIREGRVQMLGDATIGQRYQQLFGFAKPDLEDELANVVGDVVAGQAGTVVRSMGRVADEFGDRLQSRFGTFLTRDKKALPSREAFNAFRQDNERLRDDVARTAARVRLLQERIEEAD